MNRLLHTRSAQSFKRIQATSKRPFNTNGPKTTKGESVIPPKKSTPLTSTPPKDEPKSGGGVSFLTIFGVTMLSFTALAYFVEKEHTTALHIADQPIIRNVVPGYVSMLRALHITSGDKQSVVKPQSKSMEPPKQTEKSSKDQKDEKSSKKQQEDSLLSPVVQELDQQSGLVSEHGEPKEETDSHKEGEEPQQQASENSAASPFESVEIPEVVLAEEIINRVEEAEKQPEASQSSSQQHESEAQTKKVAEQQQQQQQPSSTSSSSSGATFHHPPVFPTDTPSSPANVSTSVGDFLLPQVTSEQLFQTTGRSSSEASVGQVLTNVSRNAIILRQEMENILLKDIHNLDAPALRIRLTQLVSELFERFNWESIRISQSVTIVEKEITDKYAALMKQQRKELEMEMEKLFMKKEKEINLLLEGKDKEYQERHGREMNDAIRSQAEGFNQTLSRELNNQAKQLTEEMTGMFNNHIANLQQQYQNELLTLLPRVEAVSANLTEYTKLIDTTQQVVDETVQIHRMSTALLGLELLLSNPNTSLSPATGKKLQQKLQEMKDFSSSTYSFEENASSAKMLDAIIDSIPAHVKSQGLLSFNDLVIRFQVLHDEVRKVALAPETPSPMVGQLIGSFLASISLKPKGYIQGNGTEEIMARAYYQLERGKLRECLQELESVKGYSKVLLKDWQQLANDRLVVDQALLALKAESLIRHKSFKV
jgi:hypothetical protein